MRRWLVAGAVVLSASACASSGASGGDPVRGTPPAVAPSASARTHGDSTACLVPRDRTEPRVRGPVGVDAKATGVIAVWLPGMNQRPCRAALTRGNGDLARRLAKDIAAAPEWPKGTYSCPMDDATSARLYFTRGGSAAADLADVQLTGCSGVGAPGRRARRLTARFGHDLASIAPEPWRSRL